MGWLDYFTIEPWGSKVADIQHGELCALLANCHRDSKLRPTPFKREDFMLMAEPEPEVELTDAQVDLQIEMILGG